MTNRNKTVAGGATATSQHVEAAEAQEDQRFGGRPQVQVPEPAPVPSDGLHDQNSLSGYIEHVSADFPKQDGRARAGRRRSGTIVPEAQVKKHDLPGDTEAAS
jgi:hypothetical protein